MEILRDEKIELLIFDEILYAIGLRFLSTTEVCEQLKKAGAWPARDLDCRGAPTELIEMADQVTEMHSIKHPWEKGEKGRLGLDF